MEATPLTIQNILFVQVNPCIRNVKIAAALKHNGVNVHLAYIGKTPQETYGFGNEFYASIHNLGKWTFRLVPQIQKLITQLNIQAVHYHNYPDKHGAMMIRANLPVPVIYDQHDFFSQKRQLNKRKLLYEKICNEQADGNIYITEKYKNLVAQKYRLNTRVMVLPNFALGAIVPQKDAYPYKNDKEPLHLVYIGLITQYDDKVRNLIDYFKMLSRRGFIIHVYPTRSKAYPLYEAIPNVVMHRQLPLTQLVKEISAYDFGILFLNKDVSEAYRAEELRFGAWNKFYDYITAGLPVITFTYFEYMAQIVQKEGFGPVLEGIEEVTPELLHRYDQRELRIKIQKGRGKYFMENNIRPLIKFYEQTLREFKIQ